MMSGAMRYGVPAAVLVGASALSRYVLPGVEGETEQRVVASALTLDLTVVVPGLVYFLLVRARRVRWLAVVPVVVAGFAAAALTIPAEHQGLLGVMRLAAIPAELLVVGYLVVLARRAWREGPRGEGDFATRLRAAARGALPIRVAADILATEVAVMYYALRGGKRAAEGPGEFSVHRTSGYGTLLAGLGVVIGFEAVVMHVVVGLWSAAAAWVLTGLTVYALVWLVGDYRAIVARPMRVAAGRLSVRVGLRWEAEVPLGWIEAAEEVAGRGAKRDARAKGREKSELVAVVMGEPNVRLRLGREVEVIGLFGMRRRVRETWVRVDEPARFCAAVNAGGEVECEAAGR